MCPQATGHTRQSTTASSAGVRWAVRPKFRRACESWQGDGRNHDRRPPFKANRTTASLVKKPLFRDVLDRCEAEALADRDRMPTGCAMRLRTGKFPPVSSRNKTGKSKSRMPNCAIANRRHIENRFGKLKDCGRIHVRYARCAEGFTSATDNAAIVIFRYREFVLSLATTRPRQTRRD